MTQTERNLLAALAELKLDYAGTVRKPVTRAEVRAVFQAQGRSIDDVKANMVIAWTRGVLFAGCLALGQSDQGYPIPGSEIELWRYLRNPHAPLPAHIDSMHLLPAPRLTVRELPVLTEAEGTK